MPSLYPDFTPYVSKYGDNGKAYSKDQLNKYFVYYKLNSANYFIDFLKIKSESFLSAKLAKYRAAYYLARTVRRLL